MAMGTPNRESQESSRIMIGICLPASMYSYDLPCFSWGSAFGVPLLGAPWDLVTTYNWAYNLTYNPTKWAYRGYPNYRQGYKPSYK